MPFMTVPFCSQGPHLGPGPHRLMFKLLLKAIQRFSLLLVSPHINLSCM